MDRKYNKASYSHWIVQKRKLREGLFKNEISNSLKKFYVGRHGPEKMGTTRDD